MMVPIACTRCGSHRMEYQAHDTLVPGTGIGQVQAKHRTAHALVCPNCEATSRIYMPPVLFVRASNGVDLSFVQEDQGR